jgi:hypothetical protein
MRVVRPAIVGLWRERIDATTTLAEVRRVLEDLCAFRVLDPACGNFLYVAYRASIWSASPSSVRARIGLPDARPLSLRRHATRPWPSLAPCSK